jgi:haloalkane dehalogenase
MYLRPLVFGMTTLTCTDDFFFEDVTRTVREYNQKLQISNIPKLLIYGEPGGIITKSVVDWCVKNLSNLTTANIGAGIHYLQDNLHAIGPEIAKWYETISK